ncbi:MAG: sporulation protein YunB [Tepidanaerobacteraceae bacterium]|jgi:sporulation protein YunB
MFRVQRFLRTLKSKSLKPYLFFFIIVFIFYSIFNIVEQRLTPTIIAIAEARTRIIATEAINEAVRNRIVKNVQYKDLISIHKDTSGHITLIQINTIEINRLESETALEVINTLRKVAVEGISIPMGAVTGSAILAQYGPNIRIGLSPAGALSVNTIEAFEEAGINQTRHRIGLEILTDIRIAIPLIGSTITVKTDVPLAETIIIGNVPHAILHFK